MTSARCSTANRLGEQKSVGAAQLRLIASVIRIARLADLFAPSAGSGARVKLNRTYGVMHDTSPLRAS